MVSQTEKEERVFAELLGDSRYKPLGRQLDSRAHRLIDAMADAISSETLLKELCTEDVTMITGKRGSGQVHKGVQEVFGFCILDISTIRIIITTVDRRRIICPVEVYLATSASSYEKQRTVMIFDADDNCKIKRVEMRPLIEPERITVDVYQDGDGHEELYTDNNL
ncbi:hypothetical protein CGRA01v4_01708 [Colletotrichum graminicola]|uniref:SnoaL-like domain-containing protein n=1 Tax=Colletotrichum graminicola (strain M1.001 / M2 / FGSC 10212) TaxID=645133 RepID=E3QV98_COLGM|nr:uncharacterized protein GLRG_09930 [Colletotrichum graminicola M1.001]EFQ34786.1 hypothetical protein GLRG_09930 [Colletotrichum graminicola M1.001]WDK10429.1 hypothetical protein CGRA01v4_01708 [Colletotrichum graminicola]